MTQIRALTLHFSIVRFTGPCAEYAPMKDRPSGEIDSTLRRLPATTDSSREGAEMRREKLRAAGFAIDHLAGDAAEPDPATLAGRVEGFIGYARIPLGVAGPVRIRGAAAEGEFFVPLATSEGTLVASFQHAFNVINRCGGAAALCTQERVARAPCFEFESVKQAGAFALWLPGQIEAFREVTTSGSRYCRLLDLRTSVVGNTVYVVFEFSTGDAAGQNMVTAAGQALCEKILASAPAKPRSWLVESVLSGDKRASPLAFRSARGRNASAEIVLPARTIERYWRTTPYRFVQAWQQAVSGCVQSGAPGLQGNVANAIAALFIATGQDVACVSEATTGLTRIEPTSEGDVYASVTLPNLIIGTVGGGTSLPTAQECLSMLGCAGAGHARKLAEICAVVALAGELAIVGAMSGGHFASAHAAAARTAREGGGQS